MMHYEELKVTDGVFYLRHDIDAAMKKLEWLNYEVAPEWSRFCSFGPEDIGGVWEQIGAIRRKPTFDQIVVSEQLMQKLNENFLSQIYSPGGPTLPESLFGIPVVRSAHLQGMTGMMVRSQSPFSALDGDGIKVQIDPGYMPKCFWKGIYRD